LESHVGTKCGTFKVEKIGEFTLETSGEDVKHTRNECKILRKIFSKGDEYFTYLVDCDTPKACTVVLRGASKDVLNEIERNLHDAWAVKNTLETSGEDKKTHSKRVYFCFQVARNILIEPKLLPGGGATEMEISCRLAKLVKYKKK
jgi:T-complex protein 1 subunit gamma